MTASAPIILIGYKGSGKSTVGRQLAFLRGIVFFDLDDVIEAIYERQRGVSLSCSDIHLADGVALFRALESQALKEVSAAEYGVLSTGGGTPFFSDNAMTLRAMGRIVFLRASLETIEERLADTPAFLEQGSLRDSFLERQAGYAALADEVVAVDGREAAAVAEEISQQLYFCR